MAKQYKQNSINPKPYCIIVDRVRREAHSIIQKRCSDFRNVWFLANTVHIEQRN